MANVFLDSDNMNRFLHVVSFIPRCGVLVIQPFFAPFNKSIRFDQRQNLTLAAKYVFLLK